MANQSSFCYVILSMLALSPGWAATTISQSSVTESPQDSFVDLQNPHGGTQQPFPSVESNVQLEVSTPQVPDAPPLGKEQPPAAAREENKIGELADARATTCCPVYRYSSDSHGQRGTIHYYGGGEESVHFNAYDNDPAFHEYSYQPYDYYYPFQGYSYYPYQDYYQYYNYNGGW